MRKSLLLLGLSLTALVATASPAPAAFFAAEAVDGPSADIAGAPDVDLARDGSGALVYLKREGGVEHVFASRLAAGAWQAPERVDAGLSGASSQPVVAVSDGGRVVVAFLSGGQLYGVLREAGATAWPAPAALAPADADPSLDMSLNGVGYVTFTSAGDIRAVRLDRVANAWSAMPAPLDVDPARAAGHSRVAVSADGTAIAVWEEGTRVVARKLFGMKLSTVPQDLTMDQVEGHAGGAASAPDVDIEDDSSFAWAVFRQDFDDHSRTLARRLLGSTFDPPVVIDGELSGSAPRIDISGRGEGAAAVATPDNGVVADLLHFDVFGQAARIDTPGNGVAPAPAPAIGENGSATVSWLQDATVHGRHWDIDQETTDFPAPEPDTVISNGGLGPVDAGAGMDAAAARTGDAATAFVQGQGADRRLVVAPFDRPPGRFWGLSGTGYRSLKAKPLKWSPALEIWGPVVYTVYVDDEVVGQTTDVTSLSPPVRVRDGRHRWHVVATDRRGQTSMMDERRLKVDETPPSLRVSVMKSGALVRVRARAHDRRSGLRRIVTRFGDGHRVNGARAGHRYRHSGTYRLKVVAIDYAGARRKKTRTIRVTR